MDLSLIDTQELLDAIGKRFDAHVFIAVKAISTDHTCDIHFDVSGMVPTCLGLAHIALDHIDEDDEE